MTSIPPMASNSPFPIGNTGVPNLTQIMDTLQHIVLAINNFQQTVSRIFPLGLASSKTYDPPSLSTLTQTTTTVTCAGAVLGMSAQAAFSLDLQGITVSAYISAANTVTIVFFNGTSGTLDLSSGILSVWARSN